MTLKKIEAFVWSALTTMLIGALIGLASACATLRPNPTDTEIQQTRKIAVKVFSAVEVAGTAIEGVQQFEIRLHDAGRVTDASHRAFQQDLLITARIVRSSLTQIQAATRVPELRNTLQVLIDNLNDLKTRQGAQFPDLVPAIGVITASLSVVMSFLGA